MYNTILKFKYFFFVLFIFLTYETVAQNVSISLGNPNMASNQTFQITASVNGDRMKSYSKFPDIRGFQKSGTSNSSSTTIVNGRITASQSIIQNYRPTKEGTFKLSAFSMNINGKSASSKGTRIKVGKAIARQQRNVFDFFGLGNKTGSAPVEFVDVQDDAFFALTTSKNEVFVGEGFTVSLAFYISFKNQAQMSFFELGEQLGKILKKVKPSNCWEENFEITSIEPDYVELNGERYKRFKIYETTFFPLNDQDILFPSTGLKMVKYKVAKQQTFFGRNRKQDFKTFYSSAKTVKVNELPPHPLKEEVSVGVFRLVEKQSKQKVETGNSVSYKFEVRGLGNIAGINEPTISNNEDEDLLFYTPNIAQNIVRENGRVYGSKAYQYFIEPQEPGEYQLSDYMNWIYFDTKRAVYDTLRPKARLTISGVSKKNETIASNSLGGFYEMIDSEDNSLRSTLATDWTKIGFNMGVFVLLGVSLFIAFKKKE